MAEQEMSFLEMQVDEPPVMEEDISNEQIGMMEYNQVLEKVAARFSGGVPEIMKLIEEDEADIKQFKEKQGEFNNLFDERDMESPEDLTNFLPASVPGESLTGDVLDPKKGTLGKYPWETPPEINSIIEAFDTVVERKNNNPTTQSNILKVLEGGIPAEFIARTTSFKGFLDGLWTVDISELLVIPLIFEFVADAKDAGTDFTIFNDAPDDEISDESVLEMMKEFNPDKLEQIKVESNIQDRIPDLEVIEEPVIGSFLDMEDNENA